MILIKHISDCLLIFFRLLSLSELNISANDLEDIPASLGLLRNIRTLYADENYLSFIPSEVRWMSKLIFSLEWPGSVLKTTWSV